MKSSEQTEHDRRKTKQEQIDEALEFAREQAFMPIVHMNRKERRTKVGRIMQRVCEEKLRQAVLVVLNAAKDIPDDE